MNTYIEALDPNFLVTSSARPIRFGRISALLGVCQKAIALRYRTPEA
jgi:hypothetical protein